MQKNVRYTIDLDAKTTQIVGILPEVIVVRYVSDYWSGRT